MCRQIAARVMRGEDPGVLVSPTLESATDMLNRVKEILREAGFDPQTGEYEPVSGPKPPIVMSGPVYGGDTHDSTFPTLRDLSYFDRL